MRARTLSAPTIHENVNTWPALVDLFTSLLMFFLLIFIVQRNLDSESLSAAVAHDRRTRFMEMFKREYSNELKSGAVSMEPRLNQLRIQFGELTLFETGDYELRESGREILRRLPAIMRSAGNSPVRGSLYQRIQIEGHTDHFPYEEGTTRYPRDNWELSSARALSVLKFLTLEAQPPLPVETITANGRADTDPISDVPARNRRIEILIFFAGEEFRK